MDVLAILIIAIAALLAFDVLAVLAGADSRDFGDEPHGALSL